MPLIRLCLQPGCSRVRVRDGRCAAHLQAHNARRGTTTERGYGADWQKLRAIVLASEPLCRHCNAQGRTTAATQVDHIVPIERAPQLRLVRSNLQPLCDDCHGAKTAGKLRSEPMIQWGYTSA